MSDKPTLDELKKEILLFLKENEDGSYHSLNSIMQKYDHIKPYALGEILKDWRDNKVIVLLGLGYQDLGGANAGVPWTFYNTPIDARLGVKGSDYIKEHYTEQPPPSIDQSRHITITGDGNNLAGVQSDDNQDLEPSIRQEIKPPSPNDTKQSPIIIKIFKWILSIGSGVLIVYIGLIIEYKGCQKPSVPPNNKKQDTTKTSRFI